MSTPPTDVPLSEMIQDLRHELELSMRASQDAAIRFAVESVEIDVQVTVKRQAEGQGGIRFWVVGVGGKASTASEGVQTLRLKLKPVSREATGEVLVSNAAQQLPG